MTSAGVMQLKFILQDDPLLQAEVQGCQTPTAICEMAKKLGIELVKADLLRIEAQKTLCLTNEELETWFDTPYQERVLISLDVRELSVPSAAA